MNTTSNMFNEMEHVFVAVVAAATSASKLSEIIRNSFSATTKHMHTSQIQFYFAELGHISGQVVNSAM